MPLHLRRSALALRTGAVAGLMVVVTSANGQLLDPYQGRNEWNPTDAELAQLPPYCQADLRPQVFKGPGTQA